MWGSRRPVRLICGCVRFAKNSHFRVACCIEVLLRSSRKPVLTFFRRNYWTCRVCVHAKQRPSLILQFPLTCHPSVKSLCQKKTTKRKDARPKEQARPIWFWKIQSAILSCVTMTSQSWCSQNYDVANNLFIIFCLHRFLWFDKVWICFCSGLYTDKKTSRNGQKCQQDWETSMPNSTPLSKRTSAHCIQQRAQ
jgi:hypothetical protein